MMARTMIRLAVAVACTTVLLPAGPAVGQQGEIMVAGMAVGPDNEPLAGQRVVLHRVDAGGGATIAEAETDPDGSFVMSAPATADTSALYFVAARYEGELYIGPPFRADQASAADQLIQVGVPGMSATALLEDAQGGFGAAMPSGRPATARNWLLLIIPLVGVAGVALFMLVPRSSIPEDRRLLIQVAELDERMTTAPQAQRETLAAEREQIMARLRAR
jgi:hypothetical protein